MLFFSSKSAVELREFNDPLHSLGPALIAVSLRGTSAAPSESAGGRVRRLGALQVKALQPRGQTGPPPPRPRPHTLQHTSHEPPLHAQQDRKKTGVRSRFGGDLVRMTAAEGPYPREL